MLASRLRIALSNEDWPYRLVVALRVRLLEDCACVPADDEDGDPEGVGVLAPEALTDER